MIDRVVSSLGYNIIFELIKPTLLAFQNVLVSFYIFVVFIRIY